MKDYYEEYWNRDEPPPNDWALGPALRDRVWQNAERSGLEVRRLFEVGCGTGHFLTEATERVGEVAAMDIADAAVAAARRACPAARVDRHAVEDLPWPVVAASCDLVVSLEVIEHLLRPRRLLEGAFSALRPGGYLALSTPHHGLLKNIALSVAAFDKHFDPEGDHLRFFSDRALRSLAGDVGFENIRISRLGRIPGLRMVSFVWARRPSEAAA